ncbi:MAG: hypothetical protein QG670_1074 [Thermoproteota archaeon]|nr:hypothetical protein [Thermoproteota archaeon]
MELFSLKLPLVREGDNIVEILLEALKEKRLSIEDGDIIAVADKIIATSEGRILYFKDVKLTKKSLSLAKKYKLEPQFVELVLKEADEIFGGVPKAILTLKNNVLIANAGIDHKNVPNAAAVLWSVDPNKAAAKLKKEIEEKTRKRVGVILVDSHVNPMRMGTIGFALGMAGLKPIRDCRGSLDLYDKPLIITRMNVVDDLAAAAHLLMGETAERTPTVIIRDAPIELTDEYDPNEVIIPKKDCMYMRVFLGQKRTTKE